MFLISYFYLILINAGDKIDQNKIKILISYHVITTQIKLGELDDRLIWAEPRAMICWCEREGGRTKDSILG